jgi:hypothetical protein
LGFTQTTRRSNMPLIRRLVFAGPALAAVVILSGIAGTALASAPPVGPLPVGPTSTIHVQKGELVAVALPDRAGGRVWRIARSFDSTVVREVSEANVGKSVVLVFRTFKKGSATLKFGLTRGERSAAYESRTVVVRVG